MKLASQPPVFLVGCPRSGTTLLQSLLAAHSQIASFPESKFFQYLIPLYEPKRHRFKIASRQIKPRLTKYFEEEISHPEMLKDLPIIPFWQNYSRSFIKKLNILTHQQNKSIFLEKTPEHIYFLDYIEELVPDAKIIHILRNGADVVASLYEITHKYPRQYPHGFSEAWSIDYCLERWKEAFEISSSYLNKSNHFLVKYEKLVENTQTNLEHICQFIGVEFESKMLEDYRAVAKKISLNTEHWKAPVSQNIQNTNHQKFYKVFDESQREYIKQQLADCSFQSIA